MNKIIYLTFLVSMIGLSGCQTTETTTITTINRPILIDCRTNTPYVVTNGSSKDPMSPQLITELPNPKTIKNTQKGKKNKLKK